MSFEKRLQGDVICQQGDDAQRFYIIVTGRCDIIIKTDDGSDQRVNTLGPLEYFGESSLIGANMKRNATVIVASESLQLLLLGKTVFEELVESGVISNSAFEHAKELAEARANIRYSHALQKTKMFHDLPIESTSKIIDAMEVRTYKEKEHLIQQGEESSEFLVILQGTASVQVDGNEVRTFQRLDFMGEAALVNENHVRGATVTATKLVHALVLTK
jgi:CRP-like cAMP-binding protein